MKPKITATLLACVIFLGGVGVGIMLDRFCLSSQKTARLKHFKKFMGPKRFDMIQKHLQEKFTRELKLNPTQQDQLREIFNSRMPLMKAKAQEHDAELEAMKEQTRQRIFGILDPPQKERFSQMIKEYKARRARGSLK